MTDKWGFTCFEELPEEYKKVESIYEFITIDPNHFDFYLLNVGQKYLIYNDFLQVYEAYEITPFTVDTQLLPFLEKEHLFLLPSYSH
jgi:hypothetical protein